MTTAILILVPVCVVVFCAWHAGHRAGMLEGAARTARAIADADRAAVRKVTGSTRPPTIDFRQPMSLVYLFMHQQAESLEAEASRVDAFLSKESDRENARKGTPK